MLPISRPDESPLEAAMEERERWSRGDSELWVSPGEQGNGIMSRFDDADWRPINRRGERSES